MLMNFSVGTEPGENELGNINRQFHSKMSLRKWRATTNRRRNSSAQFQHTRIILATTSISWLWWMIWKVLPLNGLFRDALLLTSTLAGKRDFGFWKGGLGQQLI